MHYKNLLRINEVDKYTLLSNNETDRIRIDNRILASYRPSYDINKTIFILRNSFMHFLKIYEFEQDNKLKDAITNPSILYFIKNSSSKLKVLSESEVYNDDDKLKFTELYDFINKNLIVIDNKYNEEKPEYDFESENIKYKEDTNKSYLTNIIDSVYEKIYVVKDFLETSLDYILKTIFT